MRASRWLCLGLGLGLSLAAEHARAFCRTTTCSPGECQAAPECAYCLTGGLPLYWPGGCTSFSTQVSGTTLRGISAATTGQLVEQALAQWIAVDCGGAPPSPLWASDPAGFGQVGCIYTAQGFEYDYAGVIIGPDLVWRTDRWVAQREGSKDPAFRSRTSVTDAAFDALIRNVYKVLLTRGMRGAALLSTDRQTQDFLATLLTGAAAPAHRSPSPG